MKKLPPPAAPSGHKASLCKVSSEIVSTVQTNENGREEGMRERIPSKKLGHGDPCLTAMEGQGREEGVLFTWKERNILRKEDALSVRR